MFATESNLILIIATNAPLPHFPNMYLQHVHDNQGEDTLVSYLPVDVQLNIECEEGTNECIWANKLPTVGVGVGLIIGKASVQKKS